MVVHVPVEEADEGAEDDRARVEAEVRHVVRQSRVLGGVAQHVERTAVEGAQRHHHRQQPEPERKGDGDYGQVTDQHHPGPEEQLPPELRLGGGKQPLLPLAAQPAQRQAQFALDGAVQLERIDDAAAQEVDQHLPVRPRRSARLPFRVDRGVQRVLVMNPVAGPEPRRVVPAEEADDGQKHPVEQRGPEHAAVHQFVEGVDQERAAGAVEQQQRHHRGPRQPAGGEEGGRSRDRQQTQVAAGLQQALRVAAPVEAGKLLAAQGRTVPVDLRHAGVGSHAQRLP